MKDKMKPTKVLFKEDYNKTFKIKTEKTIIDFVSGQYVAIGLDTPNGFVIRPYSIVSSPNEPYLEFFISVVTGGQLTPHLSQIKAGDTIYLLNPKGKFVLEDTTEKLFIATGTGIAPFVSMIRNGFTNCRVIWGNSYQHDFTPYKEELQALVPLTCISSRENEMMRLPEFLRGHQISSEVTIMACGNPAVTHILGDIYSNPVIFEDYWKEKH